MADVLALGSIRILFIRQALMIRHVLLLLTLFIPACRSGAPVANNSSDGYKNDNAEIVNPSMGNGGGDYGGDDAEL